MTEDTTPYAFPPMPPLDGEPTVTAPLGTVRAGSIVFEPVDANPSVDERPSNDNEVVDGDVLMELAERIDSLMEHARMSDRAHDALEQKIGRHLQRHEPVSTPPRSQEDGGVTAGVCIWEDEHRHVDGDGNYIWHAHPHTDKSKADPRKVDGFDERNHHDPSEHGGLEEVLASGWLHEPYAGAPKPVEGSQERSETGGEWTRTAGVTALLDQIVPAGYWSDGVRLAVVPEVVERAIARDAEERAFEWEQAYRDRTHEMEAAEERATQLSASLDEAREQRRGMTVLWQQERERATQAEGQREALERRLQEIATAVETRCYAYENALGGPKKAAKVKLIRHAYYDGAWSVVNAVRAALSPSTEATPSEEK